MARDAVNQFVLDDLDSGDTFLKHATLQNSFELGDSWSSGLYSPSHSTTPFALQYGAGAVPQTASSYATTVAFISGENSDHTVASQSYWAWNGDNPATYSTNTGAFKWGANTAGTAGGTITYYFDSASHWNATEKAEIKTCLTLWSDIANVSFAQASSAASADIVYERNSSGQAYTSTSTTGSGSPGQVGGTELWTPTQSTITIDPSVYGPFDGKFTTFGGYGWETILHETGHALGLGHSGPYNGSADGATQQFSVYDTRLWSIMSYFEPSDTSTKYYSQYPVTGTNWGTAADFYGNDPTTPMILDMLAINGLYGASTSAAYAGGQVFGFHCNITDLTKKFYDFAINTNPVVTIFDHGTGNTLNLSGFGGTETVNLTPGTFSSCNGQVNNIAIAVGTKIDTFVCGTGSDVVKCNNDGDTVRCGTGSDKITGGAGNDVLYSGTGVDTLSGANGHDRFVFAVAADSTGVHHDKILGFDALADKIHIPSSVTGIDTALVSGALSTSTFDGDLTAALSSHLGANHAVEFTPNSGTLAGHHFLVVDLNGQAGYQSGSDLVIELTNPTNMSHLTTSDFI